MELPLLQFPLASGFISNLLIEGISSSEEWEASHGKSERSPILISGLNKQGEWQEIDTASIVEVEGILFEKENTECPVYAVTNRGNIELTVVLFHSKKEMTRLLFIDVDANCRSKILFVSEKNSI